MSFLFVDKITSLDPGRSVTGIKHISLHDQYKTRDAAGRIFFMSSLVGETLGQLAAWLVMFANDFTKRPVAGIVASAHMHRPAFLGETLLLRSVIDELDDTMVRYHSEARIDGERVFTIESAIGPLLPMRDFIAKECVRRQFEAIYRPSLSLSTSEEGIECHSGQTDVDIMLNSNENVIDPTPMPYAIPVQFDRILTCVPGETMVAQMCVSAQAPWVADHFPRHPVLPLTILLECKLGLARQFMQASGFASDVQIKAFRRIKMSEFVHSGDILTTTLSIKKQMQNEWVLGFLSEVSGHRVCVAELVIGITA